MDNKDIREMAAIMIEMGLTSLEYRSGSDSIRLRRPENSNSTAPQGDKPNNHEQTAGDTSPANTVTIKSPMVGVYYSAPGVDEEPYVAVGDTVHAGDVICLIEAMKIMNEITTEYDGVIIEVYAENREVVEFGQPLFRIAQ